MDRLQCAVELLPQSWRTAPGPLVPPETEEIRLRIGRAPTLLVGGTERIYRAEPVEESHLLRILEKATGASMHTAAPALAEGYISCRGIRIGVCGTGVYHNGVLSGFRELSSLAIRVPRECRGICDEAARQLLTEGFENTLILGRPGDGKTTALRELIRSLSEKGYRVGVVDERNELAAVDGPAAQFDLGRCSDVLTGVPKAEGAMMLLRGMNPQILAMDEISREKDLDAALQVCGCGVGLLASAHAAHPAELRQRGAYRALLDRGIFARCLLIERHGAERRYRLEKLCP